MPSIEFKRFNPHWISTLVGFHLPLLVFLNGVIYFNTLESPFVWDDMIFISQNPHFQDPKYWAEYFTENFCKGMERHCAFYRPLVALSYLGDFLIWGNNPLGFHLTNVLIHILVVILFYRVTLSLFRNPVVSLVSALIFSVHPIHVESVAFVAGRTDPPTALFLLIAFYCFNRYLRSEKKKRSFFLGISWITYGMGLLMKEMAITLPLILMVYDVLFVRQWVGLREWISRWRGYAGYGLVVVIYFVVRKTALGYGFTKDLKWGELGFRLITAPALVWDYFRLLIVPYPLVLFHDEPGLSGSVTLLIFGGWVFLGLFFFVLFRVGRTSPGILFGGFWFVISLLPVLNLIPIPFPSVVERFAYIPSLGFSLAMGFAGAFLFNKVSIREPNLGKGLVGVFFAFLTIFSWLTIDRNRVWQDEVLLWEDVYRKKSPEFPFGHVNLGRAYHLKGDLKKAEQEYHRSLHFSPSPGAYHYLGIIYQSQGKYDEAMEAYRLGIDIGSKTPQVSYHPGMGHFSLGMLFHLRGDLGNAEKEYRLALEFNPQPDIHQYLGLIYLSKGETVKAIEEHREAIRLGSKNPQAFYDLGALLAARGDREESISLLQEAIRLKPGFEKAHFHLAILLDEKGDRNQAQHHYQLFLKMANPQTTDNSMVIHAKKRLEDLQARINP